MCCVYSQLCAMKPWCWVDCSPEHWISHLVKKGSEVFPRHGLLSQQMLHQVFRCSSKQKLLSCRWARTSMTPSSRQLSRSSWSLSQLHTSMWRAPSSLQPCCLCLAWPPSNSRYSFVPFCCTATSHNQCMFIGSSSTSSMLQQTRSRRSSRVAVPDLLQLCM